MSETKIIICYNDYTRNLYIKDKNTEIPQGVLKLQNGKRIPYAYFFNDIRFGTLDKRKVCEQLLFKSNWILLCPASQLQFFVDLIRDITGFDVSQQLNRPFIKYENLFEWYKLLNNSIRLFSNCEEELSFQFYSLPVKIKQSKHKIIEQKYFFNWYIIFFISFVILLIGIISFLLESKYQKISQWAKLPLKQIINQEQISSYGNINLLDKLINEYILLYLADYNYSNADKILESKNIFSTIKSDRLAIAYPVEFSTDSLDRYQWSKPFLKSGDLIVGLSTKNLSKINSKNVFNFYPKAGFCTRVKSIHNKFNNEFLITTKQYIPTSIENNELKTQKWFTDLIFCTIDIIVISDDDYKRFIAIPDFYQNIMILNPNPKWYSGKTRYSYLIKKPAERIEALIGKIGYIKDGSDYNQNIFNRLNTRKAAISDTLIKLVGFPNDSISTAFSELSNHKYMALVVPALRYYTYFGKDTKYQVFGPLQDIRTYHIIFNIDRLDLKQKFDEALDIFAYQRQRKKDIGDQYSDFLPKTESTSDTLINWLPLYNN